MEKLRRRRHIDRLGERKKEQKKGEGWGGGAQNFGMKKESTYNGIKMIACHINNNLLCDTDLCCVHALTKSWTRGACTIAEWV